MRRAVVGLLLLGSLLTGQGLKRPAITGVAHVSFYVHEMPRALTFYRDLLGYTGITPAGESLRVWVNERQFVELVPEEAPGTDRLQGIAFETADAEGLRAYLASRGLAVPESTTRDSGGTRSFTVRDPDGHAVRFVESARRPSTGQAGAGISPRVMHAGVLVGDLKASLRFYGEILGFVETWRGSRDGKVLNWVNARTPEGDTYVEFMLYDRLPAAASRGTAHHLCLEVTDIVRSKAWLEARIAMAAYGRPLEVRTGINRRRQLNLYDPDGTRTELMEPRTVDGAPAPSSPAPPPR